MCCLQITLELQNFETSSHAQTILQMTVEGHTLACVEDVCVHDNKCNVNLFF